MTTTPTERVLTDASLFDCVTSFMTGWPQHVVAFYRAATPTYTALARARTTDQREPFPQCIGFLVHTAIAANSMRVLQSLVKLYRCRHYCETIVVSFRDALSCAAYFGRLDMLEYLYETLSCDPTWTWEPRLLVNALRSSQPSPGVLEWLCAHAPAESIELNPWETVRHFELGNADVALFLYRHGFGFPALAMDAAAAHGHLSIVAFLHDIDVARTCTSSAMNGAAANGHLDVVQFLHERRDEGCTTLAMDSAAGHDHLEVVQFLHEHRSEGCTTRAMDSAAANGHLEVVQFLHEHRTEGCTTEAMDQSAAWTNYCDHMDFRFGHHAVATTKRELFYCNVAEQEQRGHVPDSHTAIAQSFALDPVARQRHLDVVRFLHDHRTEGCTSSAMDEAARLGHLEVVQFLHERRTEGCTTLAMDDAAWRGHLAIVQYLHEHRSEGCTTDAIDYAAREGHLDVIRFLYEHRTEGCTTKAMDHAVAGGHFDVAKYLQERGLTGSFLRMR